MSKPKINLTQLSELMKLELTPKEVKQFRQEMEDTLATIANLNELLTDKVGPTSQTTGIVNRFLNEPPGQRSLKPKQVFQNSRSNKHGYFCIRGLKYSK